VIGEVIDTAPMLPEPCDTAGPDAAVAEQRARLFLRHSACGWLDLPGQDLRSGRIEKVEIAGEWL